MLSYLAAALALGIAGFDPVGSFVLLGALGMGARRSGVAALTIASVSTSFMLAVPGILGLTALLEHLGIRSLAIPHVVWVWMALACGVGLVVWGVVRVVRRPSPDDLDEQERRPRSVSTGALVGSGVLVGLTSLADPAFWAMLVHATQLSGTVWAVGEAAIWVLCSHSLLVVLAAIDLVGGHAVVARVVDGVKERHADALRIGLTVFVLAVGALLAADGLGALTTGRWFLEL